ncbi:PI-PLC X domain-containing protein [Escovopsis weberi]|uniref:PI-PLC X domain-containing protein n=1 Tax=Escovopsis weberi TaxID=150374 RepID=A0A0M9VUS3_ESCWE|nr:PI-PLC X domain-containing protein [Escovopsis weberi]
MRASIAALSSLALLAQRAFSQRVSFTDGTSDLTVIQGTNTRPPPAGNSPLPTDAYPTHESKITISGVTGAISASNASATAAPTASRATSGTGSGTSTGTGTRTGTALPEATNKQTCNGWVEFCSRKYSNITMVGAHNSPFVRPGNSGSNQALPVKTQLDDGIRFLQAQMQWPANGSVPHFCHTTCDLLDAGPITDWLGEVYDWVDRHPYDVVTILLENGNYSDPSLYAPYIEKTGLLKYAYEPTVFPMDLEDWPTLETLIVNGKRVIFFIDYKANQTAYPWWLDEFSQMWETQFDQTNRSFPCNAQRPPDLSDKAARDRMYMLNHNLNAEFDVFGTQLLVPAVSLLNTTNAGSGFGSLGLSANNCVEDWGRPPNVLNVDYYNYGSPAGSVFEVAALANNVSYVNRCCGMVVSGAARLGAHALWGLMTTPLMALALLI